MLGTGPKFGVDLKLGVDQNMHAQTWIIFLRLLQLFMCLRKYLLPKRNKGKYSWNLLELSCDTTNSQTSLKVLMLFY